MTVLQKKNPVKNVCFEKNFVEGWMQICLLYNNVLFFNLGDDGLKVEGIEVGMVSLVGKILSVEHGETKSTIVIEDHTGSIEAVQWHDENSESAQDQEANGIIEGADVRILGSVRTQQEKRYLMVSR